MAETKYGKYFKSGARPGSTTGARPAVADLDDDVIKGSYSYYVHRVPRSPYERLMTEKISRNINTSTKGAENVTYG